LEIGARIFCEEEKRRTHALGERKTKIMWEGGINGLYIKGKYRLAAA
jgi:hypothetical protein